MAEEERRRARRERQEATAAARSEAEAAVALVHEEIEAARQLLTRETLTETRLEEQMRRLEERLTAITGRVAEQTDEPERANVLAWRVGMRAGTASGFEGTISELDAPRGRATLQVGGIKAVVELADLVAAPERAKGTGAGRARGRPADPGERPQHGRRGDFGPGTESQPVPRPVREPSRVQGPPPRAIPSSLDLRGARVEEAVDLLERYIDQAAVAGAGRVTVIHGHGSGALRDVVREHLASHPLVREWRPGERGEGGDGATVVSL
jgi:DNA mismatch repair protein MutS2